MYVVGKDMPSRRVFVVAGRDHPALYTRTALLQSASWVAGNPPPQLTQVHPLAASQHTGACSMQTCSMCTPTQASSLEAPLVPVCDSPCMQMC